MTSTLGIKLSKSYTIWSLDVFLVSFTFRLLASLSLLATSQTCQALSYLLCICYSRYPENSTPRFSPGALLLQSLPKCHFAEAFPDHPIHHGTPEHTAAQHLLPCSKRRSHLPQCRTHLSVCTIRYRRVHCSPFCLERCLAHSYYQYILVKWINKSEINLDFSRIRFSRVCNTWSLYHTISPLLQKRSYFIISVQVQPSSSFISCSSRLKIPKPLHQTVMGASPPETLIKIWDSHSLY